MKICIFPDRVAMGKQAAQDSAAAIRAALESRGSANIVVAAAASQIEVLAALVREPDIDWSLVTGFHLDEYLGLPMSHPASFRKYLKERLVDQVPVGKFHYISGEGDAQAECDRLGKIIRAVSIDVAIVGIGENGHLAFNDPPADFETEEPYLVVDLDDACRQQQVGEGWFPSFDDVPRQAISMSIHQIMKSGLIVCSVPDERKAEAVRNTVEGPVTPLVPASILQRHPAATLYLDRSASSLLDS